MKTIEVVGYSSIEEYNFDKGFDVCQKDIQVAKEKLEDFCDNNLFGQYFTYITLKNDKIIFNRDDRMYDKFLIGKNDDKNIKEGVYTLEKTRTSSNMFDDNEKEIMTFEIKNEDDYGKGLFETMIDKDVCDYIEQEYENYMTMIEKKHKIRLPYSLRVEIKPLIYYYNMTKQEVIDDVLSSNKAKIDNELKIKLEEEQEKSQIEEQRIREEKDFKEKDIIELYRNNSNIKNVFDKNKAMVTHYKPLDTPISRFNFKSLDYMNSKSLIKRNKISNMQDRDRVKSLVENDCSVRYDEYDEDKQEWDTKIDVDIENRTFNGVKVARAKINFLINRICDYYEKDIDKYKNKDYIEQLNKLSGVKVDVCDIDFIKADRKYDIPIGVDIIDKDNFIVNIFNEKKVIEWNTLKEHLITGRDVCRRLSKSKTIKFLLALGLTTEQIKTNIDRVRILHKLKGNKE